jgi:16S rRNA (cytosine967-C5)-methyltransferase
LSRFHAYLRNAASLVKAYNGRLPLAIYLKQYFAANKKFGSSDRRMVGALTHQYYRAGHLTDSMDVEEGLLLADLLCNNKATPVLQAIRPEWIPFSELTIPGKLEACGMRWDAAKHTPWPELLQKETDPQKYSLSHFIQPDLFLRMRPGKSVAVKNKLKNAGISYVVEEENCLRLENGSRLDNVLTMNADAVVQDKNSQQCGAIIKKIVPEFSGILWDVCAASGGKSIMLHDLYEGKPKLVVSDIRESILFNLKERFRMAGINNYQSFISDITKGTHGKLSLIKADMILVDAPCTGSGTWARTPEQHYFFKTGRLKEFSETQFAICSHAMPLLKSGGIYIYITCSVFEWENEAVCYRLQKEHGLVLLHNEILDGTKQKADSMYIAVFRKP